MHTALLLDINSGSIGAGIVGLETGLLPAILFSYRKDFYLHETIGHSTTGEPGETAMLESLRSVLQKVFQSGLSALREADFPNHFDHVVITLSPPWANSRLTAEHESGAGVFESAPLGQAFITSSANKDLIRRIENEVIRTLGIKRGASIQSFLYVFSKVASHFGNSNNRMLLSRFTGTYTELAWASGGEVDKLGIMDFGPRSISVVLGERLRLAPELSESMLSLFVRGELDRDSAVRIDELITSLEDKWEKEWNALGEDKSGEIIFISEPSDQALASMLLASVNKGVQVSSLNSEESSLPYLSAGHNSDASLSVLASFSRMLV